MTTTAEYSLTDFKHQTLARPNLATYAAGARLSRAVSRSTWLSVEYEYRAGEFGFGGLTKEHRVTMGVEYSPPLSVTRRATFRLKFAEPGRDPRSIPAALARAGRRRLYPLQGEASVDYPSG